MIRWLVTCALVLNASAATAQTAPYPAAPPCPTHNNRLWHGLWDSARGCHYDHQHGDNPHSVDDLFGTSLFARLGGEVSHPWQTFSTAGYENALKHAGYFWHVRRDIQCLPGQTACLTAFRVLVHQHATGRDAPVRFHSGVLEAATLEVATGRRGYIQVPGVWLDFGDLLVDGTLVIDEPGNGNRHKQHQSAKANGSTNIIWYGASQASHTPNPSGDTPPGFIRISTTVMDAWDTTDPLDPGDTEDYNLCYGYPRCRINATLLRPHLITVSVPRVHRALVDPDGNGVADWRGYTDRYGVPVGGCTTASLDCIPVVLSNLSTSANYGCDQWCAQSLRDYDIYFGGVTAGWSEPVP